ncbi:MAG: hypothetical protein R3E42_04750 [Burkholderiaceae bacterium]
MPGRLLSRLLLQAVFVLLAVGTRVFVMAESLPGDSAYPNRRPRGYDVVNRDRGIGARRTRGRTGSVRWAEWLTQMARGDLGRSMVLGDTVVSLLAVQLGHTVWLSLVAWSLALLLGLSLGILTALRPDGWLRHIDINTVLRASPSS